LDLPCHARPSSYHDSVLREQLEGSIPAPDSPFDSLKSSRLISSDMPNVAVSWTGGKDSSLALYEAEVSGCEINCLVTFAPSQGSFLAHPIALMRLQAQALDLSHYVINVEEPFEQGYENAISSLKEKHGVDALVTGDISEVADHDSNWMADRGERCGVDVLRPLWHRERLELLNRLLLLGFKVVFSYVKRPWFTEEWLGLELSHVSLERLCQLSERTGLDMCGEQGEYHTWVLDGPRFRKSIRIASFSKHAENSTMYIHSQNLQLVEKDA
jgi:diphthine-ammonia ligase